VTGRLPLVGLATVASAGALGGGHAALGAAWGLLGGSLTLLLHAGAARRLPADARAASRRAAAGALARTALRLAFLAVAVTFSRTALVGAAVGLAVPTALLALDATRT